jgi:hypothetical protein
MSIFVLFKLIYMSGSRMAKFLHEKLIDLRVCICKRMIEVKSSGKDSRETELLEVLFPRLTLYPRVNKTKHRKQQPISGPNFACMQGCICSSYAWSG